MINRFRTGYFGRTSFFLALLLILKVDAARAVDTTFIGGGNWNVPGNWSNGVANNGGGDTYNAFLPFTVVTVNTAVTIDNLSATGSPFGALTVNDTTLTVLGTTTFVNTSFAVPQIVVTSTAAASAADFGAIAGFSGTLAGVDFSVRNNGGVGASIKLQGGIQAIGRDARVSLSGTGSSLINSVDSSDALAGLQTNAGAFEIVDRTFTTGGAFANTGSMSLRATTVDSSIVVAGALAQNTGGTLTAGSLNVIAATGRQADIQWEGAGIQTIAQGASVRLDGAGASLRNSLDASDALAGIQVNQGNLEFWNHDFTTAGNFSNAGTLSVNEGSFVISGSLAQNTGGVLTGGAISAYSSSTPTTISWEGAEIHTVAKGASIFLQGEGTGIRNSLDSSDALAGLHTNEGYLRFFDHDLTTAGDFLNKGSVYFDGYGLSSALTVNGALTNEGDLTVAGSNGTITGNLSNTGTMTVSTNGTNATVSIGGSLLQNTGGVLTAGDLRVASYTTGLATLEWQGAEIHTIGSGASLRMEGANSLIRNSLDSSNALAGLHTNAGKLAVWNRDFTTSGDFSNTGSLNVVAFSGTRSFVINGELAQNAGGVLTAGSLSVDASANNSAASISWEGAEIHTIASGASVTLSGSTSSIRNSLDSSDALAGIHTNAGSFSVVGRTFTTAGNFSNSGTLTVDSSYLNASVVISGTLAQNTGGVLTAGTLSVKSSGTYSPASLSWEGAEIHTIASGAGISLSGSSSAIRNSLDSSDALAGLHTNEGTLIISNREFTTVGDFLNAGELRLIAAQLATSNEGDFTLLSTSSVEIGFSSESVGALDFGSINVEGVVTLDGDFFASLSNPGYDFSSLISPSDVFTVITGSSLVGSFDNIASGQRLFVNGGAYSFLFTVTGDSVQLSDFAAVPEPSSLILAGLGLAALATRSRRVRRA